MTPASLRQTPLYDDHLRLGAKMTAFGGWNMPVFYSSILEEHRAVRERVGVFDISHMGQIEVSGDLASRWLNTLLTNNVEWLEIGDGQYTLMLNESGGVIDDLIVYRTGAERYFLVVNAAKIEEDFEWMSRRKAAGAALENQSVAYAALAVQGPRSSELLSCVGELPARNQIRDAQLNSISLQVARTGYTGEDGFEIFFPATSASEVWQTILRQGAALDIRPCGLGARDTLRLEVCYPLNGADLSPARSPLEAGLGFFVDLDKPDFVGKSVLARQKTQGTPQRLVAIRAAEKAPPPRPHYGVFAGNRPVGEITSGTLSPTLGVGIGLGYLDTPFAQSGQPVEIEVRGRRFPATVQKKPLYKKPC
jgi:aminomethyltransferase